MSIGSKKSAHSPEVAQQQWPADKVSRRPISELVPYARNARTHSPEQVKALAESLKQWGWTNPVLVDEGGGIIAGHGRILAAQSLGMAEVPVMVAAGWTDAQKRAYVIADNQLAIGGAGWDAELLAVELDELRDLRFDLPLIGFAPGELNDLIGTPNTGFDPDEVPPAPVVPVSRTGDLWLLGTHRLLCGDSTKAEDVARLMGGAKADMVFTDPPYGMGLDADFSSEKSNLRMLKEKGLKGGRRYDAVIGDAAEFDPSPLIALFANCREQFWFGGDYYAERIPEKNNGSWVIWDKRLDESADRMYGSCFETCWSREKHKREIARVKWAGVFGTEHEPSLEGKKRVHPTQKPIALVSWFFERWGKSEDIVVDLFGGSGSTCIAAEMTGRACYAMEISTAYCDISVERFQKFSGKLATLDADGRTFEEVKRERTRKETEAEADERPSSVAGAEVDERPAEGVVARGRGRRSSRAAVRNG